MDELERALRAVLDDPAQLQELRTLAGSLGLGQPDAAAPQEAAVPPMPPPAPPPAQPPKPPVQETVSLPEPAAAMLRQAGKADKKQEATTNRQEAENCRQTTENSGKKIPA